MYWLMLMLVVHGVKLLHNHGNRISLLTCHAENSSKHNCTAIAEDHGEKDCSVCEYKLTKDSDAFKLAFFSTPLFVTCNKTPVSFFIADIFSLSADNKGPPSFA